MCHPLVQDAQRTPPVPCDLAVGDLVTFTNDNGVQFFNRVVTGFSPTVDGNRFVYFDNEAWWFSVNPDSLTKQLQAEVFHPEIHPEIASALATKYGFSAPNDVLISKYETYAKNVVEGEGGGEGDLMDFDDWLTEYVVDSEANDLNQTIDTPRG